MDTAMMTMAHGGAFHATQYLDYLNQFHEFDQAEWFDLYETRLYIKLLALFNERGWNQPQHFSDASLCMATGINSVNTIKKAREGLISRGLIEHEPGRGGRGNMGLWWLRKVVGEPTGLSGTMSHNTPND